MPSSLRMRRSLGVGAAEAPRRVRQSQEFQQGGQGSANRPSRPRWALLGHLQFWVDEA